MGDSNWWVNRAGRIAPVSNPGSATPNYGLTYDLATAPYDSPDQFDGLAQALTTYLAQAAGFAMSPTRSIYSNPNTPAKVDEGKSLWDRAKGAASAVGDTAAGLYGVIQTGTDVVRDLAADNVPGVEGAFDFFNVPDADQLSSEADAAGLSGWEKYQAIGKGYAGQTVKAVSEAPGGEQIFWGLDKLNEGFSTTAVAASLAEDDFGKLFDGGTWSDAHGLYKKYNLNAGEAFAQMFYDNDVIQDEQRFQEIREHNSAFNFSALAFNVAMSWKMDPNVFVGKGIGAGRDLSVGRLAQNGRTREVQREILAAPDITTARTTAKGYDSLSDRLRGAHAVTLYDRAQQLRTAARTMGFENFKTLPAFRSSASGTVMAKLMQDVADDDDAWNLVFRSSIGDPDAVGELVARQGEVSDKITAIEMKAMPRLQADLERVETRYKKRLAEQGKDSDARIEIVRFGDKWLDDEATSLRAEVDSLNNHLATYSSHESWAKRALPGLDSESGYVDPNAPNSIFGNLDRLGGQGALRRLGGKVTFWQHDDYSPVAWAVRAPTKPFLKRVGVVSLNDIDDGSQALVSYLDQLDYIQGGSRQTVRDRIIGDFAGAANDVERRMVLERVERESLAAVGAKYGLSLGLMDKLGREIQSKRAATWGKFSDTTMYSPIRGSRGQAIEYVDDAGAKVTVKLPVDPTQLTNMYPLTNLTDVERTIRENMDVLRGLDTELASRSKAGVAWTKRHALEFSDEVGMTFNSLWKPMALLSVRWPMRVVADESMRVMLLAGALPHLAQVSRAGRNAVFNAGVVRPYEWWKGRRVKAGSFTEEVLSSGRMNDFDPYDYRALTNPTAAVPLGEVDLGKLDMGRYNQINKTTSERWQYLRSLEAHRANTREARAVSPRIGEAVAAFTEPTRPRWATQWDERLSAAEQSAERGFFFDPVTRKMSKTGFAVSVYPGRLRTFDRKPSAREMNYWVEKNSDLLAVPNNRVAVWLDKDTGRWHLDVVKRARRREDAMLLASKAEATEFYDIEDGFTRYLSEDFYGHFDSPLTKPDPEGPGGVAFDQDQLGDEAGFELGTALGGGSDLTRKGVGFGKRKWRSKDGRVVEGDDVFGASVKEPNIYYSVVSSRDPIRNLYGGYTRATGANRLQRIGSDYKVFDPTDPGVRPEDWAKAYSFFVNNHVRYSPLWKRMVDGQGDDEIYNWLTTSVKGRELRKRMGIRGENPSRWIDDERAIFDHLFPNDRVQEAVRIGQITPKQALELIPEGERMSVHGDTIKLALGRSVQQKTIGKVVDYLMTYLGSVPTDALVRHPYAATVYNREMRNYLAGVPADKITNNVLAAAEASARAKAVRQVRRTLYNIADEREGVHLLRFVSPFFQAQLEVLERYARISMEKPETVARLAQLFLGSQVMASPFWEVRDREGNRAKGYSGDNQVVFQVSPWMRGLVDKLPGLQGALDSAGDIAVPVSSLNMILQGNYPFVPSAGPLVTYPASELHFIDKPEAEGDVLYKWLYPFGQPQGRNPIERGVNTVLPAWGRRALTTETADMSDAAFARRVSEIGAQQLSEWERSGREGPRPSERDALEAAQAEYRLRAASSFFLPTPLTPRSPYQGFIDLYRSYIAKYGAEGDAKFYDEVGPDFYMFAQQATRAAGGMGPDVGEKRAYDAYAPLIERAPDLIGVLTGPYATGEFSDAVYQWQLRTPVTPGSSEKLRERLSPAERIAESEIGRGWVEYGKLASALDAELRNRVANGGSPYLSANTNADLAAAKETNLREIIERNPAWQDAFNSRSSEIAGWLGQAYDVAFDPALDGRTDIEYLRAYLIGRAKLQDALIERKAAGYSSSDQLSFDPLGNPIGDNKDLALGWLSWLNQAKAANPLFAEIYNRYLEGDDLSTYIAPEVSGG